LASMHRNQVCPGLVCGTVEGKDGHHRLPMNLLLVIIILTFGPHYYASRTQICCGQSSPCYSCGYSAEQEYVRKPLRQPQPQRIPFSSHPATMSTALSSRLDFPCKPSRMARITTSPSRQE
jgi:hypothetical protein